MKLDGGAMFGNAPKALWGRWMASDHHNRIDIGANCLLVKTGQSALLFETGPGAFLSPEMKQRYGVVEENHVLLESLAREGLDHTDITYVILSHLHFDHAGGLLSAYEDGASPRLMFPNARYMAGRANFDRAVSPHLRDRASFIPGLCGLLEASGRLDLKSDGDRLELDGLDITFWESQGHTPGMLISMIQTDATCLMFAGDLAPGTHWINLPITMGYDRFPELLAEEKQQILARALETDAWVVYPHDPACAASKLELDPGKQRFMPIEFQERLDISETIPA